MIIAIRAIRVRYTTGFAVPKIQLELTDTVRVVQLEVGSESVDGGGGVGGL